MDAWNPDQLKKMQCGGNSAMNEFFQKYGVQKHTDIKDKYNSQAAEFYREKIKAEAEGRVYTPPDPSSVAKPRPKPSGVGKAKSFGGPSHGAADWDAWDEEASGAQNMHASHSEYTLDNLQRSANEKEDFFARKMNENALRPEGIPPSQGGKYVGFGSTPAPSHAASFSNTGFDDVSGMIGKKFSELSVFAKDSASSMNNALKDAGVAEKTKEYGVKGWALLRSAYATAASTIESTAAQQGIKVDLGRKKVADSVGLQGVGKYASIDQPPPSGYGLEASDAAFSDHTAAGYNDSMGYQPPQRPMRNNTASIGNRDSGFQSLTSSSKKASVGDLLQMDDTGAGGEDWADWGDSNVARNTKPSVQAERKKKPSQREDWNGWDPASPTGQAVPVKNDDDWGTW